MFRGRSYVTSDTLVLEPGFSSISGPSVNHGFYVGDDPPMTLTLDLEFDTFPEEVTQDDQIIVNELIFASYHMFFDPILRKTACMECD